MAVLTPPNRQPITLHFREHWVDPLTGQRLRRVWLGACSTGRLILSPLGNGGGPVELLWRGSGLTQALSPALVATAKNGWQQMCHKPRDHWHPVKLRDELYWLSRLPAARYLLETEHDAVQLWRIEKRIQRPRTPVANGLSTVIAKAP